MLDRKRHLKDYRLGEYLDRLVVKGIILFVMLDCCHSGGADRTGDNFVHGLDVTLPAD